MDLRIVNTCNNNCFYCLEKDLRSKSKYISKDDIFLLLEKEIVKGNITFYWWNPLLHKDLLAIVKYCYDNWFRSIGVLSNTYGISYNYLEKLKYNWLTSFWFYFNSFNTKFHNKIVNWWIKLSSLIHNLSLISRSWLYYKSVIHINQLNVKTIYKDIYILYKLFWVRNFEFINYFPFWNAYDFNYNLSYDLYSSRNFIDKLFYIINSLKLNVSFKKFSKDFFWDNIKYYDFDSCVINQVSKEDYSIINGKQQPRCKKENRCNNCFLKDICKFY